MAGAGKSNAILYVVSRLRELGFRFIVLVFSLAAKEELISRGLLVSEVSNFHAFVMQAYRRWIDASLNEHAVMASDAAPGPLQRTEATIAPSWLNATAQKNVTSTESESVSHSSVHDGAAP